MKMGESRVENTHDAVCWDILCDSDKYFKE